MTALHHAISAGHSTVLEILLQAGANPRVGVLSDDLSSGPVHETPTIIFAVETGNLEIVRSLVETISGSDLLHEGDAGGVTPLLRSIQLRHLQITEYLLSKNANPNTSSPGQVRQSTG
jgi:ankyrin repeat protein